MLSAVLPVLLASAGLIEARSLLHEHRFHMHKRAEDATGTTLSPAAIQSGSFNDGSDEIGSAEVGQAKSLTSTNNFINNCAGKTLTNGLQIIKGSCNGITMGDIPAQTNMVSSIITFPLHGSATIESDTTFNISVQMSNLVAGSFTNADSTYYAAPQALSGGKVVGHTHVTVQDMGSSLNPTTALNPTQFAFFKGINDAGNGKGLLQATVTGGLPAGNYRVCTLASASNHQPVLMPVAQRGTSDDCTKFTVIGSGTTINEAANDGSKGEAAAALVASAVAAGPDNVVESSAASSEADTTTSSALPTSTSSSHKSSGNGNSSGHSSGSSSKTVVTIIETFFEFSSSLGGLCPSVGKSGDSFNVLGGLFDDLQSAAAASCGHQFNACIGISGPGFSIEECTSQKDSCSNVASAATTSAAPATITATVSVPVTVSVTGSIISSTVSLAETTSTPCISTQTITVSPPVVTAPASTGVLASAFFFNSTRTAS